MSDDTFQAALASVAFDDLKLRQRIATLRDELAGAARAKGEPVDMREIYIAASKQALDEQVLRQGPWSEE